MTSGPVPLRTAIGYAIDICESLSVAPAAGVVHRDLKPANVVVTSSGSVKALDFGIAKLHAAEGPTAVERTTTEALTEVRAIVGTLGYLSPEQAHGRVVDGRSDIFSLGVVLHEMIAGHRVFQGDSAAALLSSVLSHDPVANHNLS